MLGRVCRLAERLSEGAGGQASSYQILDEQIDKRLGLNCGCHEKELQKSIGIRKKTFFDI